MIDDNLSNILKVIRDLIIALSIIHESGYVYNNFESENIMITMNLNDPDIYQVKLIDYRYATMYIDDEGKHLKNIKVDMFHGNILFGSLNSLNLN
jgi:serine/threonine protein kinase